jgi:hypothetical protein
LLPAYIPILRDGDGVSARIAGKRFDRARVMKCLERGINQTEPLEGDPERLTGPGVGTTALLEAKLEAGGFSAVSVNSAKDLRDKADYLGMVWTKKFGRAQGLQRYGEIRSLVLHDAAIAFEESKRDGIKFGIEMLQHLRKRFAQRRQERGLPLHECSDEHLAGFAYSLTSECQVYWSLERPWEREQ